VTKFNLFFPPATSISDSYTNSRQAEYVAKLRKLVELLRLVARVAEEAANLSEQIQPRTRLVAMERRIDGRIRELLQRIEKQKVAICVGAASTTSTACR
jgi:hypothetical protein